MADTSKIEQAAKDLGKMIADHEVGKEYQAATKAFNDDVEAQRLISDFSRTLQSLAEKQAQQQPIEVADKKKLEDIQTKVAMNLQVRRMQTAQMNYLDLVRKSVNLITEESGGIDEQPAGTPAAPSAAGAPGSAPGMGGLVTPGL
jgi:cell fate (sporulation/competence/biofilm development) regulator YlbF (YheA/YmcA/DUF963 family)